MLLTLMIALGCQHERLHVIITHLIVRENAGDQNDNSNNNAEIQVIITWFLKRADLDGKSNEAQRRPDPQKK